jgi:hypothetical protein
MGIQTEQGLISGISREFERTNSGEISILKTNQKANFR